MKNLLEILNNNKKVDEYKIIKSDISSTELFFIKEQLQMNRGKDVSHTNVVVYKNFEENGVKFKGSSVVRIGPSQTIEEIEEKVNQAALAASFVKNAYYDLPKPTQEKAPKIESNFKNGELIDNLSKLVSDLYSQDNQFGAFVNSCEFFINRINTRIMDSNGLDVEFESYNGLIEIVVEANGEKESIEIFNNLTFSEYDPEWIKERIIDQLRNAALRSKAILMPNVENIPVIISTENASEFWGYYTFIAGAAEKYQRLHTNNVGDNIQGENIIGDKVSMTLKPYIPNSIYSRYFDNDGVFLKDTEIIKDGIIKKLIANNRYAQYLKIETTGNIPNIVISAGSKTEKELKSGPYLEIISFSNFQMDNMTGNFGGEFRLGIYFDGEKEIPVKLGAISGNVETVKKEMYFSKEIISNGRYLAPKFMKFKDVSIAGN